MSSVELAEHLARRLHTLKLCRSAFATCQDWECKRNREQLDRLAAERERDGVA